jgi:hypothetical protein
MIDLRAAYLDAADSAVGLLRTDAVLRAWDRPSALPEFSVAGLAGHLAHQVLSVPGVLDAAPPEQAPIALLDHYAHSSWRDAPLDSEVNVGIREQGEAHASAGPAALAKRTAAAVAQLRERLPAEPAGRVVLLPWAGWALRLEDFLTTRMMEITVHSDDLAASVDEPAPELPEAVFTPVLGLLSALAVRRHGQSAVLRALARAERAPAAINAI